MYQIIYLYRKSVHKTQKKKKLEPKYIVNAEVTPNARVYINKPYIAEVKTHWKKRYLEERYQQLFLQVATKITKKSFT